jgi:hypothetical protein
VEEGFPVAVHGVDAIVARDFDTSPPLLVAFVLAVDGTGVAVGALEVVYVLGQKVATVTSSHCQHVVHAAAGAFVDVDHAAAADVEEHEAEMDDRAPVVEMGESWNGLDALDDAVVDEEVHVCSCPDSQIAVVLVVAVGEDTLTPAGSYHEDSLPPPLSVQYYHEDH